METTIRNVSHFPLRLCGRGCQLIDRNSFLPPCTPTPPHIYSSAKHRLELMSFFWGIRHPVNVNFAQNTWSQADDWLSRQLNFNKETWKINYAAFFNAERSSDNAFLDNTHKLCVNTHQLIAWRLYNVILLRNGRPKKTFLKMPIRASVWLRLVCNDTNVASVNFSCNSYWGCL